MYLGCSRDTYKPLDQLLYISSVIGDNCFIRLRGWSFSPWAVLLVLERLIPLSNKHSTYELDVGCPMASLRISHKAVALIRRVLSQSEIFLLRWPLCCLLVLILVKIIMLLLWWMNTEKLFLKHSLSLILLMAEMLCFLNFPPILLILPILRLAWRLQAIIGSLFILSSLRKDSFSMLSIQSKPMAGAKVQKSVSGKTIPLILFWLLTSSAMDSSYKHVLQMKIYFPCAPWHVSALIWWNPSVI